MGARFYRFLDLAQVNACVDMLNQVGPDHFPHVPEGQDTFWIKAPDGDIVFSGMVMGSGRYCCGLHREVFEEEGGLP